MENILRVLRKRRWATILVASLCPAAAAGVLEFVMSGGTSGWVPLWAGLAGGIITALVLLLVQSQALKPADRVFTQRSANELVEQVRGLTEIAAKPIVDRYAGTWFRVRELPVYDITERGNAVIVDDVPSYARPGFSLSFDKKEWSERLKILDRGDHINVRGRISDISDDIIWLEQCELFDDDDSA